MAIKKKGKSPAAKSKPAAETSEASLSVGTGASAKLTISIKRRLSNGDEMFIAPGIEMHCAADELDAKQAEVTERVNTWMDELLEQYPDADPIDEADEDEADDEEEDDEADDDEDEDELTEEYIKGLKKAELQALADEYEVELESKTVKEMKAELIEILFEDEADEDEADDDEEDDEDEDEEELTEDDLNSMKLDELQEMCDEYEIDHPKLKKGAKLAAKKKAYVAHIMEALAEE